MNKIERNEMIVELATNGKTKSQIVDEIKRLGGDVSERTVQRVISDSGLMHSQVCLPQDKIGQNGFFVSREMWETLLDKIDSLLDTVDIQNAKISNLEAEVVNCKSISTNSIHSDKKYIGIIDGKETAYFNFEDKDKMNEYLPGLLDCGFITDKWLANLIKKAPAYGYTRDCGAHFVKLSTEYETLHAKETVENLKDELIDANERIIELEKDRK